MSDKPVAERLQVKGDRRLAVIGASAALEKTVGAANARADLAKADVVLLFAPNRAGLEGSCPVCSRRCRKVRSSGSPIPNCPPSSPPISAATSSVPLRPSMALTRSARLPSTRIGRRCA
jgi:hypothetical protein